MLSSSDDNNGREEEEDEEDEAILFWKKELRIFYVDYLSNRKKCAAWEEV